MKAGFVRCGFEFYTKPAWNLRMNSFPTLRYPIRSPTLRPFGKAFQTGSFRAKKGKSYGFNLRC